MLILIFLELLLLCILDILHYKLKNPLSSGWQYLFNTGFAMIVIVAPYFIKNRIDMFNFLEISIIIASTQFYAIDYIKYLKDKNNIALAQKTAKNAALNHFLFIFLLVVIQFFDNYYKL